MTTGYEVTMYHDISNSARHLSSMDESLKSIAESLKEIASSLTAREETVNIPDFAEGPTFAELGEAVAAINRGFAYIEGNYEPITDPDDTSKGEKP